jgi:hypothetical protein
MKQPQEKRSLVTNFKGIAGKKTQCRIGSQFQILENRLILYLAEAPGRYSLKTAES